jgi:nicotinamide-nucleotide amidase
VRLTSKANEKRLAETLNASLERKIRDRLQEFIFGVDEETYEGVLSSFLRNAGITLAVAETAFGSSIIQTLKSMAGSENFLQLGVTVVNPETAHRLLFVMPSLWQEGNGVNEALAKALAEGVRSLAGSDLGLGITGRVGKEKGQDHVVYIALAHSGEVSCIEQRWSSALRFIENRTTKLALSQVKKELSK